MAKRIISLTETQNTYDISNGYFAIDTADTTYKVSYNTLKNALIGSSGSLPYVMRSNYTATSWYRVWSDGWCEQGGFVASTSGNKKAHTITMPIQFLNTNYFILVSRLNPISCGTPLGASNVVSGSKRTNSFQIIGVCGALHTAIYWEAKGQINV